MQPEIEPMSPGPLANCRPTRPMSYNCVRIVLNSYYLNCKILCKLFELRIVTWNPDCLKIISILLTWNDNIELQKKKTDFNKGWHAVKTNHQTKS